MDGHSTASNYALIRQIASSYFRFFYHIYIYIYIYIYPIQQ